MRRRVVAGRESDREWWFGQHFYVYFEPPMYGAEEWAVGFGLDVSQVKLNVGFMKYPRHDARPQRTFYLRRASVVRRDTLHICKLVAWPFTLTALSRRRHDQSDNHPLADLVDNPTLTVGQVWDRTVGPEDQ